MDVRTFDKKNLREQARDRRSEPDTATLYRHAIRDGAATPYRRGRWNGDLC
jgi:hypothetical protein